MGAGASREQPATTSAAASDSPRDFYVSIEQALVSRTIDDAEALRRLKARAETASDEEMQMVQQFCKENDPMNEFRLLCALLSGQCDDESSRSQAETLCSAYSSAPSSALESTEEQSGSASAEQAEDSDEDEPPFEWRAAARAWLDDSDHVVSFEILDDDREAYNDYCLKLGNAPTEARRRQVRRQHAQLLDRLTNFYDADATGLPCKTYQLYLGEIARLLRERAAALAAAGVEKCEERGERRRGTLEQAAQRVDDAEQRVEEAVEALANAEEAREEAERDAERQQELCDDTVQQFRKEAERAREDAERLRKQQRKHEAELAKLQADVDRRQRALDEAVSALQEARNDIQDEASEAGTADDREREAERLEAEALRVRECCVASSVEPVGEPLEEIELMTAAELMEAAAEAREDEIKRRQAGRVDSVVHAVLFVRLCRRSRRFHCAWRRVCVDGSDGESRQCRRVQHASALDCALPTRDASTLFGSVARSGVASSSDWQTTHALRFAARFRAGVS